MSAKSSIAVTFFQKVMENVRPDGSIILPGTMLYWTPGEFGDKVFCIKQDLMFYNPAERPAWFEDDDI